MPMRVDCKFYESRSYPSGDTVRMCRLDLAPEAPWRCPDDCPGYQRKMMDAGWVTGSLTQGSNAPEDPPRLDAETAALLDSAESIINAAGPDIIADIESTRSAERKIKKRKWWWPF